MINSHTMTKDDASNIFRHSMEERASILKPLFESTLREWQSQKRLPEGPAHSVALRLSQDCGNALMLILDYAIVRFLVDDGSLQPEYKPNKHGGEQKIYSRSKLHAELKQRKGDAYNGIRLGEAIATLADVARHIHEFQADDPAHPEGYAISDDNRLVLEALCQDKQHTHAAAAFLDALRENEPALSEYAKFAERILEIAS